VFGSIDTNSGLFQVTAGGGEPTVLTTPDRAKGETNHWYPSVLPAGRGVLFTITARNAAATAQVAVLDSRTGKHKTLTRGSQAQYVEGGHLLYSVTGTLHAVRFDLERLEMLGDPMPVVEGVWTAGGGAANYGVSRAGTLVYVPAAAAGTPTLRSLVWVDRSGKETPISAPPRAYQAPRLSPDGTRVALTIGEPDNDIYVWDLDARGPLRRLTFDPGIDAGPVWTPDGQRIIFRSGPEGQAENLFTHAADGSGTSERLTTSPNFQAPSYITPDGTGIVGYQMTAKTAFDIVWFPMKGSASRPLIGTPSIESNPEISADGRFIAYQSNESGRYEIYVRRFPDVDAGGRWQPSSGAGGTRPVWARNGQELFYLDLENKLTAVPVQTSGGTFAFGSPAELLDTAYVEAIGYLRPYDVAANGQRFLMIKANLPADRAARPAGFVVVLNWFEEMKAKLPAGR